MATVPRSPLISLTRKRVWIHGVHDQGSNDTPTTLLVTNPPIRQRDWLVPPSRSYANTIRTWLNDNPNLYTNDFPIGDRVGLDVPRTSYYNPTLKTWTNENPNLYTNAVPPKSWDYPAPPSRPVDITLRTWVNNNPNLYTNPIPVQNPEFPVPPPRAAAIDLHAWVYGSTAYIPAPVVQSPFQNPEFPVPPARTVDIELRTWLNSNPNLYANAMPPRSWDYPVPPARPSDIALRTWTYNTTGYIPEQTPRPQPNPEWPVPQGRPRSIDLLSWTHSNNGIYTNQIPFNQVDWPTPEARFHGPSQKAWVVPTNPNIFPPPPFIPSAGNDKQFIGEIQSLGLGSIFDSSMGVT